ncbi:hypothetical protein AB6A40_003041 [Gnathostoma spinigerum]|uniref:Uncharacterized protein n=1 Tax=Gnathostoma spinigerum TaxID=75299 RepID=A0ABD6EAM6_9BILA
MKTDTKASFLFARQHNPNEKRDHLLTFSKQKMAPNSTVPLFHFTCFQENKVKVLGGEMMECEDGSPPRENEKTVFRDEGIYGRADGFCQPHPPNPLVVPTSAACFAFPLQPPICLNHA